VRGIFEGQVGGWYRVPSSWPVSRDFDLIKRWFEYRFHSMLVDLCEDRWSAMNSDIGMRSKYRYSGPKSYFRTLRDAAIRAIQENIIAKTGEKVQ